MTNDRKFVGLEYFRFILAFSVMIYHYYYYGSLGGILSYGRPSDGNPLFFFLFAVECFFILSGFVVTMTARSRHPLDFVLARLVRLLPVLLICSTLSFIPLSLAPIPPRLWATLDDYLTSITVIPLLWHRGVDWSLWSLTFELRFYVIIFVMCLVKAQARIQAVCAALLVLDTALELGGALAWDPFLYYLPYFLFGMLLYDWETGGARSWAALGLLLATGAAVCWKSLEECNRNRVPFDQALIPPLTGLGVGLAIIVLFLAFLKLDRAIRLSDFGLLLGKASYPLYVLHQVLGYWLILHLSALFPDSGIDWRPVMMAVMVASALLIARHVEPAIARRLWRLVSRVRPAAGSRSPPGSSERLRPRY